MDIAVALDHLQPWYTQINPKAYVPTMIVHKDGGYDAICESAYIIKRIDKDF